MPGSLVWRRRAAAVGAVAFLASVPAMIGDAVAGSGKWIVDETNQCGTSNPFLVPGERIRWYGPCANGRLQGRGTLIWYRGSVETERNEGNFSNGEFDGDVLTTFPDGQMVFGQYVAGVRHGEFMIIRVDGKPIRAVYDNGTVKSQTEMTTAEVEAFKHQRLLRLAARETPPATVAPTAVPTPSQPVATVVAEAPATTAAPTPPPSSKPDRKSSKGGDTVRVGESSGWGVGKALSYANPFNWELNPLKWGVVDKVTGLFKSEPEASNPIARAPTSVVRANAPAPQAQAQPEPQPQQLAQARPAARPTPRPALPQTASTPPAPQPQPVKPSLPVAQGPAYVNTAPPGFTSAKNLYDMSVFMNEPHPFADTPGAKASIPIVGGVSRYVSGVFQSTDASNGRAAANPTVTLANGWHSEPPPSQAYISAYRPVPTPTYTPAAATLPGPSAVQTPAADSMFTHAYQFERAGDYGRAQVLYEQIVMQYPSAPSARLANDRLTAIRAAATQSYAGVGLPPSQAIGPTTNYVSIRDGDKVIAVNSPIPDSLSRGLAASTAGFSQVHSSNYINRHICSRSELYDGGAVWCGVVRSDEGTHFVVEVRDVQLGTFGQVGISRSTCTGDVFLNWFSRGTTVRVPKNCFRYDG